MLTHGPSRKAFASAGAKLVRGDAGGLRALKDAFRAKLSRLLREESAIWSAGLLLLPYANRGCERGAIATWVAMRDCRARAVLHAGQTIASNWRVCILQPDQDAIDRPQPCGFGVSLNSDCAKKVLRTAG